MKGMALYKAAALLLAVFSAGVFAGCGRQKGSEVTDFETVSIYCWGTSTETEDYEIVRTENGVSISYYRGRWEYEDDVEMENCLEKRYEGDGEDYKTILTVMNDCSFASWDGFDRTNQYALDGGGFMLTATVNEDRTISARGQNAYPKGYADFMKSISSLLDKGVSFDNKGEE